MGYNPNSSGSTTSAQLARSVQTGYINGTAGVLLQGMPVSASTTPGQMVAVDITSDASVNGILGVISANTPSAAFGNVTDCGRLENITTSFVAGNVLYINIDGTLTTTRPSAGVGGFVSGMYVIFVGIIVQNQFNPSNLDLKIYMDVIGQL